MEKKKIVQKSGKRMFEAEDAARANILKGKECDAYEKQKKVHGSGLY